jgi:hypothetical protein
MFSMAMARWQLGDKEQARQWYGQAVKRMEKLNQSYDPYARNLRAEAVKLMGITE